MLSTCQAGIFSAFPTGAARLTQGLPNQPKTTLLTFKIVLLLSA
jgi:hypothetical protein